VVAGCAGGAAWASIPGILRAFFKTNEIITSLMLNYVAAYLLTYLVFNTNSYWRQTTGFNASVFPTSKDLPNNALWPALTIHTQGGIPLPFGAGLAVLAALLLLPAIASVAVMAAITLLAGSIAAAFVLSATGGAADGDSRRMALGVVLLAAWSFGLAIAVVQRARALSPPATPVS